jgi:hypothetical protein
MDVEYRWAQDCLMWTICCSSTLEVWLFQAVVARDVIVLLPGS